MPIPIDPDEVVVHEYDGAKFKFSPPLRRDADRLQRLILEASQTSSNNQHIMMMVATDVLEATLVGWEWEGVPYESDGGRKPSEKTLSRLRPKDQLALAVLGIGMFHLDETDQD